MHLAMVCADRNRRSPAENRTRCYVLGDPRLRRELYAVTNSQVTGNANLSPDNNVVSQFGASRDPDKRRKDTASSQFNIVRDLHKVIDPTPVADNSVWSGTTVDCSVSAYLDIVADYHSAKLRNFDITRRIGGYSKAILTNPRTGVDVYAIPNYAVTKGHKRSYRDIVANIHAATYHGIGADKTTSTDANIGLDHYAICYFAALTDERRLIDTRSCGDAMIPRGSGIKSASGQRI